MQKLIITGIVGVLIGATAFSSKPSISQGPQPTPSPQAPEPDPLRPAQGEKTRRLTIAVSVSAMSDLKVSEGQTLQAGDPIADLPNPSFLEAQAQVEKSKADVDSISATITNKKAEIDYLTTLPNLNPLILDHERAKLTDLEQRHTATIRAPQAGKVRRIEWLGQGADGRLNAELTFIPESPGRNPALPANPNASTN